MSDKKIFNCKACGKKVEQADGDETVPECCEEKMKPEPLPVCQTTGTAEHSRLNDPGEPCDDGRGGKV